MEMEMEVKDELTLQTDRVAAAASALEAAAERLAGREIDLEASFGRVASREAELEERLREAEKTIALLRGSGRKTVAGTLMAKEAVSPEGSGLDAALSSLSVEQRIAVKAGLLRSGLV